MSTNHHPYLSPLYTIAFKLRGWSRIINQLSRPYIYVVYSVVICIDGDVQVALRINADAAGGCPTHNDQIAFIELMCAMWYVKRYVTKTTHICIYSIICICRENRTHQVCRVIYIYVYLRDCVKDLFNIKQATPWETHNTIISCSVFTIN